MNEIEIEDSILSTCTYCGGWSEYLRALCNECYGAHDIHACEARPMSCHACNMIKDDMNDGYI